MDRRDFVKSVGAVGIMASLEPGRVSAADTCRQPMGRALGPDESLVVHNARLVDVVKGRLFKETALLIKGGRIEKRLIDGKDSKADRRIDAGGRFIIPGLINAHCHVTMPCAGALDYRLVRYMADQVDRNCVDCILHGVTTVRDQMGPQGMLQKRMDLIASGELMGPRILRGIIIDVPGGYVSEYHGLMNSGAVIVKTVAEARDAVDRAVDMGADHMKLALQYRSLWQGGGEVNLMTEEMLAAVVDRALARGKTCAVHHTCVHGFRRALRAGIQSFEHMVCDEILTDDDLSAFIEGKRAVVPTASVPWALTFPYKGKNDQYCDHPNNRMLRSHRAEHIHSLLDEYLIPPMAKVAEKEFKNYSRPNHFNRWHLIPTPNAEAYNRAGAIGGENTIRMYEAGCRIGCGNDGGIPFVWPGSVPFEMLLNQEAGMKPADVLKSATRINAEIVGMGDELGSIDPGKVADLVIIDKDPLETMENLARPQAVLASGRLVHTRGEVKES